MMVVVVDWSKIDDSFRVSGHSVTSLARAAKVSRSGLSKCLNGHVTSGLEIARRVCPVLRLRLEEVSERRET